MTGRGKSGAEVRLDGIGKRYGQVAAVKPLDLVIQGGTLVTLLGPSGCGKTTLLRMIAGLETPSEGTIRIAGRDVTRLSAGERDVSLVFQSYALFPHMTVAENVAYGLVSSGMGRRAAAERADAALVSVGLEGLGQRLPSELSGGQQQRVAVARALVLEPAVLLFDEPLSNLDARLRRRMRDDIRELQQRLGVTVVYVTHDQSEALAVSDRIVVMRNAEIAQTGTPVELYELPADIFVAGFMGEANILPARIAAIDGASARVEIGPLTVQMPHRDLAVGPASVAVRPEAVRIGPPGSGLPATVRRAAYMGAVMEYTLDSAVGPVFAVSHDVDGALPAGAAAGLTLARRGVVLVRS
ncbi:ABC transporter ATP-binding protein [Stella sp.]|uniref:ABC transporter ATP-binding protein n=1 Tax=Stella sp. TaxID=2912054 RepID=UPI0035B31A98